MRKVKTTTKMVGTETAADFAARAAERIMSWGAIPGAPVVIVAAPEQAGGPEGRWTIVASHDTVVQVVVRHDEDGNGNAGPVEAVRIWTPAWGGQAMTDAALAAEAAIKAAIKAAR